MSNKRPQFHGSIMGYNKTEINDYLDKLETELDEFEKKKDSWSEKITAMELESIRLNNQLAARDEEKAKAEEENQRLENMILVLRAKAESQEAIIARMKQDYSDLEKKFEESATNPKRIQDAILSAQDLGKQIVDRANKDADSVRIQAEADKISKEEEGRMAIVAAKVQADQTIAEAKRKCTKLQNDYNQMLMDASGFKAELMNLYRRHMELLTAFPEREVIAVDAVQIDKEKEEV